MIRIDCRGVSTAAPAKSRQLRNACDCFVKHGYAILDHAFPVDAIGALRGEFDARLASAPAALGPQESLEVGQHRYMIPLPLSGGFGDPRVFANPYVLALAREVLGRDAILESFGAFVSFAGSDDQPPHRDGPDLFDSEISTLLPAHALTMGLPLTEMNQTNGTTAIWPGSHRKRDHDARAAAERPTIPLGSCLLWDFRLYHAGTTNNSAEARPLVYATYARCWFQDPVNFSGKPLARLAYGPDFIDSLPTDAGLLFRRAGARRPVAPRRALQP